jgi:ABC-type uncharacterized transport system substrate-binding protein
MSSGKQAARLADQIFQGIKPAELPVETGEFYLAINLKTAKALGSTSRIQFCNRHTSSFTKLAGRQLYPQ